MLSRGGGIKVEKAELLNWDLWLRCLSMSQSRATLDKRKHGDGPLGAPALKGALSLRGFVQSGQFVPQEKCCVPAWAVWVLMAQENKS